MGHSVGDAADRAVKRSEKVKSSERTPAQIFKDIRSNIAAHLAVTFGDTQWLLEQHDAEAVSALVANGRYDALLEENRALKAQIDQFRTVYNQENRLYEVAVERFTEDSLVRATVSVDGEPNTPRALPEVASAIADSLANTEA